jgi:hypothetical protein
MHDVVHLAMEENVYMKPCTLELSLFGSEKTASLGMKPPQRISGGRTQQHEHLTFSD